MFRSKEPSAVEKFDHFLKMEEEMKPYRDRENNMIVQHGPNCYGVFGECISCGCMRSKLIACPSHDNGNAYLADVNKRLLAALEKASE